MQAMSVVSSIHKNLFKSNKKHNDAQLVFWNTTVGMLTSESNTSSVSKNYLRRKIVKKDYIASHLSSLMSSNLSQCFRKLTICWLAEASCWPWEVKLYSHDCWVAVCATECGQEQWFKVFPCLYAQISIFLISVYCSLHIFINLNLFFKYS